MHVTSTGALVVSHAAKFKNNNNPFWSYGVLCWIPVAQMVKKTLQKAWKGRN